MLVGKCEDVGVYALVDENEEGGTCAGAIEGRTPDIAVLHDAWWHGGSLLLPELHGHEAAHEDGEEDEQNDNASIAPVVLGATPLEREKQGDDASHEEQSADGIHLRELAFPRGLGALGSLRRGEEEEDEDGGDEAERKINVEAPSP